MKYTIENIRNIRKEQDKTQEEFAEALDVSVNSIRNWEHGDNVPPMEKIQDICDTLNCDIDYLFGIIPQKTYLVKDMSDKTGLSEAAIESTSKLPDKQQLLLSRILEHPDLSKLLRKVLLLNEKTLAEVLSRDIIHHFQDKLSGNKPIDSVLINDSVESLSDGIKAAIQTMFINIIDDIREGENEH